MREFLKIAEMPVTEWHGVVITVRIDHPNAKDSMSYRMLEDSRLVNINPIRYPQDSTQPWDLMEFDRRMKERDAVCERIGQQIGAALIHAMTRLDKK